MKINYILLKRNTNNVICTDTTFNISYMTDMSKKNVSSLNDMHLSNWLLVFLVRISPNIAHVLMAYISYGIKFMN